MNYCWFSGPILVTGLLLSGCYSAGDVFSRSPHINNKTKFSSSAYGVAASPRVSTSRTVRKGGGRAQVGKPYKIRGKWYTPKEEPGYDKTGQASWYGPNFHGRLTANGEVYDQYALSGAHPTFPLPSYARVTNVENGRSLIVRVNDRGPYHSGRVIDLSARAAELLNYQRKGVATVRVQYIGKAPLHGLDAKYLAASFQDQAGVNVATAPSSNGRFITGSLNKSKVAAFSRSSGRKHSKANESDPFLLELDSISRKIDTGSTLSMRLNSK